MQQQQQPRFSRDEVYQLTGWTLFIVCALLYCASTLETGPWWTGFVGSVVFLVACIVFMIPLIWKQR